MIPGGMRFGLTMFALNIHGVVNNKAKKFKLNNLKAQKI